MGANSIAKAVASGKHHWSRQELQTTEGLTEALILADSAGLLDGLYITRPGESPQTCRAPAGAYISGLTPLGDQSAYGDLD